MSRSIHKTVKGVFKGKPATEINKMVNEGDPDVEELRKKHSYKTNENNKRKTNKLNNQDDI